MSELNSFSFFHMNLKDIISITSSIQVSLVSLWMCWYWRYVSRVYYVWHDQLFKLINSYHCITLSPSMGVYNGWTLYSFNLTRSLSDWVYFAKKMQIDYTSKINRFSSVGTCSTPFFRDFVHRKLLYCHSLCVCSKNPENVVIDFDKIPRFGDKRELKWEQTFDFGENWNRGGGTTCKKVENLGYFTVLY